MSAKRIGYRNFTEILTAVRRSVSTCGRYGRRADKPRIVEWFHTHNAGVFDGALVEDLLSNSPTLAMCKHLLVECFLFRLRDVAVGCLAQGFGLLSVEIRKLHKKLPSHIS